MCPAYPAQYGDWSLAISVQPTFGAIAAAHCGSRPYPLTLIRAAHRPRLPRLSRSRSSCPPVSTALGSMLNGMAGRKTSVSFDDETLDILARRAKEEGMDRSAYLARLVRRDDLRRRIAADSATLNAAGYTPDRATAVTAALIARRRAVG